MYLHAIPYLIMHIVSNWGACQEWQGGSSKRINWSFAVGCCKQKKEAGDENNSGSSAKVRNLHWRLKDKMGRYEEMKDTYLPYLWVVFDSLSLQLVQGEKCLIVMILWSHPHCTTAAIYHFDVNMQLLFVAFLLTRVCPLPFFCFFVLVKMGAQIISAKENTAETWVCIRWVFRFLVSNTSQYAFIELFLAHRDYNSILHTQGPPCCSSYSSQSLRLTNKYEVFVDAYVWNVS